MLKVATGNPAPVFAELFDRYAEEILRYLTRRIGRAAPDVLAETFLVALAGRNGYDPQRGDPRGWLYGIAGNLLRRHLRQETRALMALSRTAQQVADGGDLADRVASRVDAAERVRLLAGRLGALSAGDRDVLLLTAWAGLDSSEVAAALGIPVGTVRSRLHRVRKQLRGAESEPDTITKDEVSP